MIVGLLALNLVISFLGANISWQGHLGGLATGALVSTLYAWAPRDKRTVYGVWGTAGIAIGQVGLILLRAGLTRLVRPLAARASNSYPQVCSRL